MLSIVTMSSTETIWPQFTMQVFWSAISTSIWENGGHWEFELVL